MGIFGEQIGDGEIPETKLDSAAQAKLNTGGGIGPVFTPAVGASAIQAANNGAVFFIPVGLGSIQLTLDAGLPDLFLLTIVALNGDTTLTPASGETIFLSGNQPAPSVDQVINFPSLNHGQWILHRASNTWLPISVDAQIASVGGGGGDEQPGWQNVASQDFTDEVFDITAIDFTAGTGGVDVVLYDKLVLDAINLSPGSPTTLETPDGPLDLNPLTAGSDVEISAGSNIFIFGEGGSPTDVASGVLHLEEKMGATGSFTPALTAVNSGPSGFQADLNITVDPGP